MKALALAVLLLQPAQEQRPYWERLKDVIQRHLGRPYVWGAAGMKSFDCSGFVWRVMTDNGMYLKRTTARKMYFSMKPAADNQRWQFGNLVFFDDLKHCGIVNARDSFYHAETSKGTTLSKFDPYWRRKVCAVRRFR